MSCEDNIRADERSMGDRGRDVARQVSSSLQNVTGAFSGANVERQIAEYSELYTQVLLGLHQDLVAQNRKFQDYDSQIEMLKSGVASIRTLRIVASAALFVALAAVGFALWSILR